jgi:predicted RNA-binding Zn-ribbon protein involved in translation (DUF1610 family)
MTEETRQTSETPTAADVAIAKITKIMDVTMMCKMEVPGHPVTVYNTEKSFICPHCGTAVEADLGNMKLDHPKHDLRQIVEKKTIVSQ